jgi:hypothetical protein
MKRFAEAVFSVLLISSSAVAAPAADAGFEADKKTALATLDMRLTQVKKAQSCMTAAKTRDAFNACRMQMRQDMSEMHQSAKLERAQKK